MRKKYEKIKQVQRFHRDHPFVGDQDGETPGDELQDIPEPIPAEPSNELQAIFTVLERDGEKVLAIREQQAFQLVVREGRSERTAAELMGCSRRAVQTYVRRAGMKLRKLCQPWL